MPQHSGSIHFIDQTREFGNRGFRKRECVLVEDDDTHEQYIPFEFVMEYQLTGRKWEKDNGGVKYFLGARASRITLVCGRTQEARQSRDDPQYDEEDIPF